MIELFSKKQAWLSDDRIRNIVPIHIDDEISLLDAGHIIPFKAKAWLDLTERKARGEQVDRKNIKKHKNDIFRLSNLLKPNSRIPLSESIKKDFSQFIGAMRNEEVDLRSLGFSSDHKETILETLSQIYMLK